MNAPAVMAMTKSSRHRHGDDSPSGHGTPQPDQAECRQDGNDEAESDEPIRGNSPVTSPMPIPPTLTTPQAIRKCRTKPRVS